MATADTESWQQKRSGDGKPAGTMTWSRHLFDRVKGIDQSIAFKYVCLTEIHLNEEHFSFVFCWGLRG